MLYLFILCLSHESVALECLEENGALDEDRQRAARKDGRPRATQVKDSCKGERIVAPQDKRPGKDKDERPRSPHFSDEAESGFDQIDAEPQVQQGGDEEYSLAYNQSENLFLCVLPRGARAGCLLPPLIKEGEEMAAAPQVFVSTGADGIAPWKRMLQFSLSSFVEAHRHNNCYKGRLPKFCRSDSPSRRTPGARTLWSINVNGSIATMAEQGAQCDTMIPGFANAEKLAWYQILNVLNRGLTGQAEEGFGAEELQGTGRSKHHGNSHTGLWFRES